MVPSVAAVPGFTAETDLERALIEDPVLQEGLAWGRPRRGHPEGSVGAHVADLLATIDRWGETGKRREELRLLALVHDSFKNRVQNWRPKTGENHHAMRARRFAERYIDDERLLATIEQHDRPYALWRKMRRRGHLDEHAFTEMLDRIPDLDLFLRFVELDGSTRGQEPRADPMAEGGAGAARRVRGARVRERQHRRLTSPAGPAGERRVGRFPLRNGKEKRHTLSRGVAGRPAGAAGPRGAALNAVVSGAALNGQAELLGHRWGALACAAAGWRGVRRTAAVA